MQDFTISKNGYDVMEVDNFVTRLKADYESRLGEQKDRIFYLKDQLDKMTNTTEGELMATLVQSVEKAKQIEVSSRNIYELETKRLQLFYMKMDAVIDEITSNQSAFEIKKKLLKVIDDFKSTLDESLVENKQHIATEENDDPVQKLLSKMGGVRVRLPDIKSERIKEVQKPASKIEILPEPAKQEYVKQEDIEELMREVEAQEKNEKPADKQVEPGAFAKFLDADNKAGTNFESIMFKKPVQKQGNTKADIGNPSAKINNSVVTGELSYPKPNESGFDLKEAINPKDDLEEIMKAFDFYDEEESGGKKKLKGKK